MHSIYFGLVVHLLLVASSSSSEVKPSNKDDKVLIMFEYEPIKSEDRSKRSSTDEAVRKERQSPEVPSEYLSLLNQLSGQHQPQASASAQQSQQQLIQQLVVSRDGARQPTAARYVLSQDGRLVDESSYGLGQGQQLQSFPYYQQPQLQPQQIQQFQQQYQQQQLQQLQQQQLQQQQLQQQQLQQQQYQPQLVQQPQLQQSPLAQTQPQQLPPAPTTNRPGARAQVSEYTRQQQRILQEYRDAPLRAQIAGVASRPIPPLPQQVPSGPQSQSAQVFSPAPLQLQPGQVPPQFQDPNNPNIVYTLDSQGYFQQQVLQPQIPAQYADPRQIYAQGQRSAPVSQQFIYQQPIPQEIAQDKIRRPITVLPSQSAAQPQQALPQQYLIETSRPSAPQPQYVSSEAAPQIQYVQQPQPQPRPQEAQQSTLLQPVAGRGLFSPAKPSRSSIFVSRSSAPRAEEVSSEKVPVVRLPSPDGQRPISKQELDALVGAGYTVSPISHEQQFLKSKRQQPLVEEGRNVVVYANPQDGVQYQYSPGSSDATATIKTKKDAPNSEYFESEN